MNLTEMIHTSGEWLKGDGPCNEIVISSRVRLARNLAGFRFVRKMNDKDKVEVVELLREALEHTDIAGSFEYLDLEQVEALDRRVLMERHLISREQEESSGARAVAVAEDESFAIMVNEEDHLRLQSMRSGFQLAEAFAVADHLDTELADELEMAFDEEFGYLTACPTNTGTGLRVSVMLHLPALVITRHIEKAFRAIHDMRLAVRGLYGEGTEAYGEFYQISNQITLGRSEVELVDDLKATIEALIDYEQKARQRLLENDLSRLEDRVWRAYALLRHARVLSSEEAMRHLSAIRLGIHLKILSGLEIREINKTFLYIQPAHLQRLENRQLPPEERDMVRARYVRERLRAAE